MKKKLILAVALFVAMVASVFALPEGVKRVEGDNYVYFVEVTCNGHYKKLNDGGKCRFNTVYEVVLQKTENPSIALSEAIAEAKVLHPQIRNCGGHTIEPVARFATNRNLAHFRIDWTKGYRRVQ